MTSGDETILNLPELERRVLDRWQDLDIFAKVQDARADAEPWVFYEGPPTANGRPGVHHVWARVFKDLYPRYKTMTGHSVVRKGGWDCHGLPVELEVEKELGLSSKADIEDYGVAEFNAKCRESVLRYVDDFTQLTERAGIWLDTDNPYWTMSNDFIESVWWLLKQMWTKGELYEGHRISPYCGRCGTALSSHELAQGYKDIVDDSIYVRMPVVDGLAATEGADLLVWTTTPWTLLSNVAVAVNPTSTYVRVAVEGRADLIVGANAVERLFGDEAPAEVARFTGIELMDTTYRRPLDLVPLDDHQPRVVEADFVTDGDGSGIVHLAPAFGEDDNIVGQREQLPVLNPVTAEGTFAADVPEVGGRFARDASARVIELLEANGTLFRQESYEHSYPHCWRCGTPLIYWAKTTWFLRTSEHRHDLVTQNETIGWHPEHIKRGRFGNWLEGNIDWALSRDRYWGTPLPIWRCEDGHDTCIGSRAELAAAATTDVTDLDLHRPSIDDVELACPTEGCGRPARRQLPVLDAWFDSGSMPAAQYHHPFEPSPSMFDQQFPADFICEAIDQTRGWFYSLLAVNTLVFGVTPYRNVVCLGLLVDENGNKMSKSRGNTIDPWDIFDQLGADALRWNFFSFGQPWTPRRLSLDSIRETASQTLGTIWNVLQFARLYRDDAVGDGDGTEAGADDPIHVNDRWILSRIDGAIEITTAALDDFDALTAATAVAELVDDLSNWYVRRSRRRFWDGDTHAIRTLDLAIDVVARLLAPFCPMFADEVYTRLTGKTSVHLADWPAPLGRRDTELEAAVEATRRLVALGRAARSSSGVKVRQPLGLAHVLHADFELSDELRAEICDELNVKTLEALTSIDELMTWRAKPNFRALGPRLGDKIQTLNKALATADGSALKAELEADGRVEVDSVELGPGDLEFQPAGLEQFALSEESGWAVALDLTITDELAAEGMARSLVRQLNGERKRLGLDVGDRVVVRLDADDRDRSALEPWLGWVADEVLATSLEWASDPARTETVLDVDGVAIKVSLEPVGS